MKKNVNTVDALIRITFGLTGVAWGAAEMIRRPYRATPMIITMASAMKVAEGITRYCPMTALLDTGFEAKQQDDAKDTSQQNGSSTVGDTGKVTFRKTTRESGRDRSRDTGRDTDNARNKAREATFNEPLKELMEEFE